MSQRQIQLPLMDQLVSVNAAGGVAGPSFRNGGRPTRVQVITSPGAFTVIQVSADRVNWAVADDEQGAALTALVAGVFIVASPLEWIRCFLLQDATAPRLYDAVAHVTEDTE